MPELALGDEHGVEELLNSRVVGLQVKEDLIDEVHWPLDLEGMAFLFTFHHERYTDGVWGGGHVMEQSIPLRGGV